MCGRTNDRAIPQDLQVINRDGRHPRAESRPGRAAIGRAVHADIRAAVKRLRIGWIDAHDLGRKRRQARRPQRPRRPAVDRGVDGGVDCIGAEGHVGIIGIRRVDLDRQDRPKRQTGGDLRPGLAAVRSAEDVAVVSDHDHLRVAARNGQLVQRIARERAAVGRGRRQGSPRIAAIRRFPQPRRERVNGGWSGGIQLNSCVEGRPLSDRPQGCFRLPSRRGRARDLGPQHVVVLHRAESDGRRVDLHRTIKAVAPDHGVPARTASIPSPARPVVLLSAEDAVTVHGVVGHGIELPRHQVRVAAEDVHPSVGRAEDAAVVGDEQCAAGVESKIVDVHVD